MSGSSLNHCSATRTTVAKMLNNKGDIMHPSRTLCSTLNAFDQSSLSFRTQPIILSRNWRRSALTMGGTPKRARIRQRRKRSTDCYAFWRSIKHRQSGTLAVCSSSCNRRTANIISKVDRRGPNPYCSSCSRRLASQ